MAEETYLVTGAMGCIGAWVLKHLSDRNVRIIATDLDTDPVRPRLLMSDETIARIDWRRLDVTDTKAVAETVADTGVTRIIHLAGLQIPFCRANPPLGAAVNVTGTVNIFEAARASQIRGLAYASSLASLGPPQIYDTWPLPDAARPEPHTLYGVYKVANEDTASVYAADWGVGSIGLRPYVVYGVARDQGISADCAKAILAAAAEKPFHIRFGGEIALQHASDVAEIFIQCADAGVPDARVCNLRNDVITVPGFVDLLTEKYPEARITCEPDTPLPFPANLAADGLKELLGDVPYTPLEDAIASDVAMYRRLLDAGRLDLKQLAQ